MKEHRDSRDALAWMRYANENPDVARYALQKGYIEQSIQNSQQAIEKALKGLLIHSEISPQKTHSITGLRKALVLHGLPVPLEESDAEIFDLVYSPSKYPTEQDVTHFDPDDDTAEKCIVIASHTIGCVTMILSPDASPNTKADENA